MSDPRVVFAGGGSGGHLVPGVHLAEEIRRQNGGGCFLFLRGRRRIEGLVLERAPGETRRLKGLRTPRGVAGKVLFAAKLPALLARSIQILRRFRADAVVGLGGYGAVPAVLAARALGIKVLLLEQNARPGLANRLLGPFAHAVCCAFPETAGAFGNGHSTGNPVRSGSHRVDKAAAYRRFGFSPQKLTLFVVGGSQGARGLNRLVCDRLGGLSPFSETLQILHIAGDPDRQEMDRAYRRFGLTARVESFLPDMQSAYRVADVVFSRAGGTTLAELATAGLPAVLVPYPYHRDRHQFANARVFTRAGAGFLLTEDAGDAAAFGRTVGALLRDAELRSRMGRAASRLARPEAARQIAMLLRNGRDTGGPQGPESVAAHEEGDRCPSMCT